MLKLNSGNYDKVFVTNNYKNIPPSNLNESIPVLGDISKSLAAMQQQLDMMQEENNKVNYIKFDNIERFISEDLAKLKNDLTFVKQSLIEMESKLVALKSQNLKNTSESCRSNIDFDNSLLDVAVNSTSFIDDLVTTIKNNNNNDSTPSGSNILISETVIDNAPSAPPLSQFSPEAEQSINMVPNKPILTGRVSYADITKRTNTSPVISEHHNHNHNHNYSRSLIISRSNDPRPRLISKTDNEGFTRVVSRSKKRNMMTGTRKFSGSPSFKGATRCLDFYVGRCYEDTTSDILIGYLKNELNIIPRNCIQLNTKIPFSTAFKITVDFEKGNNLLDSDSWPEGVICRKFFNKRY